VYKPTYNWGTPSCRYPNIIRNIAGIAECLFPQSYGEVSQLVLDHLLGLLGGFLEGFSIRPAATRSAPVLKLCWLPRPGSPPSFDVVLW